MKETVNVNIGSQAFTLDEDAYRLSIWVYIILWLIVPKAPKRLTE